MKYILIILIHTLSSSVMALSCTPPSDHLFKEKFKEWFHTEKLERELREVIASQGNGERRESIKSLHRRTYFADRFLEEDLKRKKQAEFQSMVAADPRRAGAMENFPVRGAVSELQGREDGTLEIRATEIPVADQKLLSPEIRAKLGNSIKVSYHYPIDRFEYTLTYEGEEFPFDRAIFRVRDDYEMECVEYANRKKEFQNKDSGNNGGSSQ